MSISSLPSDGAGLEPQEWLAQRTAAALGELGECVERNPAKLRGTPVLKGSRITVAQILAELGEGQSADEIAADFELDAALVKRLVQGLAISLDHAVGP